VAWSAGRGKKIEIGRDADDASPVSEIACHVFGALLVALERAPGTVPRDPLPGIAEGLREIRSDRLHPGGRRHPDDDGQGILPVAEPATNGGRGRGVEGRAGDRHPGVDLDWACFLGAFRPIFVEIVISFEVALGVGRIVRH
jgi:hypothetical protein